MASGQRSTLHSDPVGVQTLEPRLLLAAQMVRDIETTPTATQLANVTTVGDTICFSANDGIHGVELWKTDGTADGTTLIKDINPREDSSISSNSDSYFTDVGGVLFFVAEDGVRGRSLWKSDGTAAGTVLVKALEARYAVGVGGLLYFLVGNSLDELWVSDGTDAGTILLKKSPDRTTAVSLPVAFKDGVVFSTLDYETGSELWQSDGTVSGTRLIKAIDGAYLANVTNLDGKLFFVADDGVHGLELWTSDGTGTGTVLVKDIAPRVGPDNSTASSSPRDFYSYGGAMYFTAEDPDHGRELWRTDGTEDGTVLVKDIRQGPESAFGFDDSPSFVEFNGSLFLVADDGSAEMSCGGRTGRRPGRYSSKTSRLAAAILVTQFRLIRTGLRSPAAPSFSPPVTAMGLDGSGRPTAPKPGPCL